MSDSNSNQAQKANLARIRDNQRRSRARRKEYLQELETKYRTCEAVGVEASTEIQTAARRVLEENRRLRQLLKQQGLSDTEIDAYDPSCESSPASSKMDVFDNSQFPIPSTQLDQLLSSRRQCKPGSACGDNDDNPRRLSCNPSISSQSSPPPALLPRPIQPQIALQIQPQPQPPQTQHQQQQQQQQQQQHTQQHQQQQPQQHRHQHLQNQHQNQHINIVPQPSPLTQPARMSTPVTNDQYHPQQNTYPIYDPQTHAAYMYPVPLDSMTNMTQWNLSNLSPTLQQTVVTQSQAFMPTTSATPTTGAATPTSSYPIDPNSSSCYVAADAIRSFNVNAGPEVEQALGCRDGSECHVSNNVVFELMDRYAGSGNERVG